MFHSWGGTTGAGLESLLLGKLQENIRNCIAYIRLVENRPKLGEITAEWVLIDVLDAELCLSYFQAPNHWVVKVLSLFLACDVHWCHFFLQPPFPLIGVPFLPAWVLNFDSELFAAACLDALDSSISLCMCSGLFTLVFCCNWISCHYAIHMLLRTFIHWIYAEDL